VYVKSHSAHESDRCVVDRATCKCWPSAMDDVAASDTVLETVSCKTYAVFHSLKQWYGGIQKV